MDIAFTIPAWLFWAIGVPVVLVIMFFAWAGFAFFWEFMKNDFRMW